MINFAYLVADDATRQAVLVDPAWDVSGLVERVEREGYTLAGALVTHYHQDHCGGSIWGMTIEGIAELAALRPDARIHVHAREADGIAQVTGVPATDLVRHEGGDALELGSVRIGFLHTPGHTPGSECFLVTDATLPNGAPGSVDAPLWSAATRSSSALRPRRPARLRSRRDVPHADAAAREAPAGHRAVSGTRLRRDAHRDAREPAREEPLPARVLARGLAPAHDALNSHAP
jgi:glyoxylase-like metal-dependent hydrolase (beta-lactamase superfamily II)